MLKPKKAHFKHKNVLLFGLILVVALLVVSQTLETRQHNKRLEAIETIRIQNLITKATDSLSKQPLADPRTGDLYFPELRLMLPYDEAKSPLVGYFAYEQGMQVSDKMNYNQAANRVITSQSLEETYKNVPTLQACSRQYAVSFKNSDSPVVDDNMILKHTKVLKNKRTAYIYENPSCQGENDSNLLSYLEKIDSY